MAYKNLTDIPSSPGARLAFGVPEVARAVGVSPGLIREEIARGRLQGRRVGKRVVVLAEDLDLYLRRSTLAGAR